MTNTPSKFEFQIIALELWEADQRVFGASEKSAKELGVALNNVKAFSPHGEFQKWLKNNSIVRARASYCMRVANGKQDAAAKKKAAGSENGLEPTPTTVRVSEQRLLPLLNLAAARGKTVEDIVGGLIDDLLARPDSVRDIEAYAALHPVAPVAEVITTDTVEEGLGPPRVVFQTNELKNALSRLKSVVNTTGGDAIYSHVRIYAVNGVVKITGVDVNKLLTITLPYARANGDVDLLVLFSKLKQTLDAFATPDAIIMPTPDGPTLQGGGFAATLHPHIAVDQFTALPIFQGSADRPEAPVCELGLAGFKRQFEEVSFAVKKNDGRFEVGPVQIESTTENLRLVATDGRMLAISEVPQHAGDFTLIVPKPALDLVSRLTGEKVTIYEGEYCFYFATELEILTHNKTCPEFPDYKRVVPKTTDGTTKVVVGRDAFLHILNRALSLDKKEEQPVATLTVSNATTMNLRSERVGIDAGESFLAASSDDVLDAIITGPLTLSDGSPVDITMNINMLLGFVERAAGLITFYVKSNVSVVEFYNGNIRFLQMPCNPALCRRWAERQAEKLRREAEAEAAAAITAVSVAFPYDEPGFAEIPEVIMEEEMAA